MCGCFSPCAGAARTGVHRQPLGRAVTQVWLYGGAACTAVPSASPGSAGSGAGPACGVTGAASRCKSPALCARVRSAMPSPALGLVLGSSPTAVRRKGATPESPQPQGRSAEGRPLIQGCGRAAEAALSAAIARTLLPLLARARRPVPSQQTSFSIKSGLSSVSQTPDFLFSKAVPEQRLSQDLIFSYLLGCC